MPVESKSSNTPPIEAPKRLVRMFSTDLFRETLRDVEASGNTQILLALKEFIVFKRANPLQPFGAKDRPFKHEPLKGIYHAGLTFDVSVLYTIEGSNPNIIKLLGVFSHDETGTGQPRNVNRQKQLYKRISNAGGVTPLTPLDEHKR